MTQSFTKLGIVSNVDVAYQDGPSLDAFSRLRVSNPSYVFDAQMTYTLCTLRYEQLTRQANATITYDATNRCALMTFAATPTGGVAYMQTFEYFPYQPGRSQLVLLTFNFIETAANVLKFAGLCDGLNGIELEQDGTTVQLKLYSQSSAGNQTVAQANWNLDKMDGTGESGIILDLTKIQILVIDFQALYAGRIRIGFDIGGVIYYVHQFTCANLLAFPYAPTMNLPIRCGMTCTGTVSTTMRFVCSSVISEGGQLTASGLENTANSTAVIAGSPTATHAISVRPKTTFGGFSGATATNRVGFYLDSVDGMVTSGTNALLWQLCVGQAFAAATGPTWADVDESHSAFQFGVGGVPTGPPTIVLQSGYIGSAGNNTRTAVSSPASVQRPVSLSASGTVRANGTLTLLVTGIGGTAPCLMTMNWKEIR